MLLEQLLIDQHTNMYGLLLFFFYYEQGYLNPMTYSNLPQGQFFFTECCPFLMKNESPPNLKLLYFLILPYLIIIPFQYQQNKGSIFKK